MRILLLVLGLFYKLHVVLFFKKNYTMLKIISYQTTFHVTYNNRLIKEVTMKLTTKRRFMLDLFMLISLFWQTYDHYHKILIDKLGKPVLEWYCDALDNVLRYFYPYSRIIH